MLMLSRTVQNINLSVPLSWHIITPVSLLTEKTMRFKISYFILEIYAANEVQSKEYVTSFLCVVRCCFDR